MGRIAFFTERLPPDDDPISRFSYDLVKTLADQQHEVRVFSTYREGATLPKPRARVEILRPFRKWNWLELPKAFPLLIDFQPDIIHFVQPRAEALGGWTNAMALLPGVAAFMGGPAIVTSFYDLREERLHEHRTLIAMSDVITLSNQPQLDLLQNFIAGLKKLKRLPQLAILPVPAQPTALSSDESSRTDEFVLEFIERNSKSIFVPGHLDEHPDLDGLFEGLAVKLALYPEASVVFGGGWGEIPPRRRHQLMESFDSRASGNRVLISGPLSSKALRFCLARSRVVLLASIARTSLQLIQVMNEALSNSAVLILTLDQSKLTPIPWKDRENAFIVNQDRDTWWFAIDDAMKSDELVDKIRAGLPDFARAEALDHSGNTMSRLYSEALNRKKIGKQGSTSN